MYSKEQMEESLKVYDSTKSVGETSTTWYDETQKRKRDYCGVLRYWRIWKVLAVYKIRNAKIIRLLRQDEILRKSH